MTHAEVAELVTGAGLRIVQMIPLAIVPATQNHPLLPIAFLESLERSMRRFSRLAPIAQDVIYVCTRM
jgi:hypothetical protein